MPVKSLVAYRAVCELRDCPWQSVLVEAQTRAKEMLGAHHREHEFRIFPPVAEPGEPRTRRDDPDTSHAAERKAKYTSRSQNAKALAVYARHDGEALTDEVACEMAGIKKEGSSWWHRPSDLRDHGHIVRVGTGRNSQGNDVMTCVVTPLGHAYLAQIGGAK